MKSVSQRLCEVRDRDYGRLQYMMARDWGIHQSTLSRWLRAESIPDPTWYDFLARKLGISIEEMHAACQIERNAVAQL